MPSDHDVLVIGDGPTGLSAALLLAKNETDVLVLGTNETPMHKALLYNYLGVEEETGTSFMERARDQAEALGAQLQEGEVTEVGRDGDTFTATTGDGQEASGRYLVLATGPGPELGEALGLEYDGKAIRADRNGCTSVDNVYAGGWATRPQKIQAAISVGDGAAIALDILSKEKGEPFHDFDWVE